MVDKPELLIEWANSWITMALEPIKINFISTIERCISEYNCSKDK